MAPQSYAQRVIADGAVNYWRLGEQSGTIARDEIGGKDGTISGGVTLGQPGALVDGNRAMRFDGINGRVVIAAPPAVIGTNPLTLEAWIKTTLLQDFKYPIDFKNDGDTSVPGVGFMCTAAGRIYFDISYGGGVGAQPGAIVPYADGAFHHIVGTIARGAPDVARLYFDAVEALSAPLSQSGGSYTSTVAAGIGSAGSGVNPFQGVIDEVAIYPYALSPAQILAHYQMGLGQFASTPQPSSAASPLVDKVLLAAQIALGAGAGVDVAGCASLAFTVVGNGTVTAGAVQLEEAHDPNYAGAWAALGAPVTVPAGAATVKLNQTAKAVRARVSTAIVGGSASVSLVAR